MNALLLSAAEVRAAEVLSAEVRADVLLEGAVFRARQNIRLGLHHQARVELLIGGRAAERILDGAA